MLGQIRVQYSEYSTDPLLICILWLSMHACTAQIQNRQQGPDHSQQILRTESLTQTQNC
jgi:hypothetical protein